MAINLSLFNGIPTTKESINRQWETHIKNPKSYGLFKSDGGYLLQKINTSGKYKGYTCLWYYIKKPKCKFKRIISLRNLYKNLEELKGGNK